MKYAIRVSGLTGHYFSFIVQFFDKVEDAWEFVKNAYRISEGEIYTVLDMEGYEVAENGNRRSR